MKSAWIALAVLILVLVSMARAQEYPDYQPLAARQYSSYLEQRGIGIAVVPIFDKQSQMQYLGIDLSARGFLPVYVLIENHANPAGAILLRDHVLYSHDNSAAESMSPQQARPNPSVGSQLASQWGGLPGAIAFYQAAKMSYVRLNLLKKELRSQTIAQGKAGGGFVFPPTSRGKKSAEKVLLDIPIKDETSRDDIHFYFQIALKPEEK